MQLNNKDLVIHERALEVSKRYLKSESELITCLIEVDQNKISYKLDYSSLSDYARRALKLSDDTAQNFVTVARKAFLVPELKTAIDEGSLTVSKARKLTPVLNSVNQAHWLALAKSSSQKTIEKEVARVQPHSAIIEQAKYVSGDTLKVTSAYSEKVYKMLKRAQDLESRKAKKNLSVNETLEKILGAYLEKNDPVKRAELMVERRVEQRVDQRKDRLKSFQQDTNNPSENIDAASPKTRLKTNDQGDKNMNVMPKEKGFNEILHQRNNIPFHRSAISAPLKRQVILRDKDQCQHPYLDGSKCTNQRFTEIHHKIPISNGGQNQLTNLTTLCSGHHKVVHLN